MPDHDKRVALVTGANRGIGYAVSRKLGEQNITVILGTRDPATDGRSVRRIRGRRSRGRPRRVRAQPHPRTYTGRTSGRQGTGAQGGAAESP